MKKTLCIVMILTLLCLTGSVLAQTETPSEASDKIDDLKERLSTKVAELRQSAPKAIFGTISDVGVSNITVDTQQKGIKIELTDDISVAQILNGKRTDLTTDDLDENDVVSVFGDYDSTIDILKASHIFIESKNNPQRIHGFIKEIDDENYQLAIEGVDGQTYAVDIETTTDTMEAASDGTIEESGFSKLETGMFVSILGTVDDEDDSLYSADRILVIKTGKTPTPTVEEPTEAPTKKVTPTPEEEEEE